jgi:outer membrane protein
MNKGCFKQTAVLLAGMFFWNLPLASCADLSVQEAVDLALAQNTAIKITQKGEDTAKAKLKSACGTNSITLTASGSLALTKQNSVSQETSSGAGITVQLPVYTGGKNEAAIASAEIGWNAALLNTEREKENIRLNVITEYYDVLEAQKTVKVDQESVDNYQAHLTNVQQLYSAGSKARIDVLRSEVELSNARQTLIKAQNTYAIDLSTLKNALRLGSHEQLHLTEDFSYAAFGPEMDACLEYAAAHRKDLIVDQYTLRQKELAVTSAKAGWLPSLSFSVGMDVSHDFQPVSSSSNEYTAGLNLSWNVFDSGVTQAAVDTAETAREVAGLTLQKDKEDVDLAVRQSYYNMKEAEKRFVSTQDAVKEAQEDYYIAREKYRAGEGLMLDIIDAQLALSTAQLNFISAQYDYARYKAAIENNIGLGIGESIDVVFGSNISKSNMHTVRATVQEEAAAVVLASGNEVTQ